MPSSHPQYNPSGICGSDTDVVVEIRGIGQAGPRVSGWWCAGNSGTGNVGVFRHQQRRLRNSGIDNFGSVTAVTSTPVFGTAVSTNTGATKRRSAIFEFYDSGDFNASSFNSGDSITSFGNSGNVNIGFLHAGGINTRLWQRGQ
jgi:hypothetical protein